nr:hypothetical protein [Achromobacter xylosoxidans]
MRDEKLREQAAVFRNALVRIVDTLAAQPQLPMGLVPQPAGQHFIRQGGAPSDLQHLLQASADQIKHGAGKSKRGENADLLQDFIAVDALQGVVECGAPGNHAQRNGDTAEAQNENGDEIKDANTSVMAPNANSNQARHLAGQFLHFWQAPSAAKARAGSSGRLSRRSETNLRGQLGGTPGSRL